MATADFNSMPQNVSDGKRDKSVPDPILTAKRYPTHLPLWLIFGKKGPTKRMLADGAVREQLYGTESFMSSSRFFTHQTQYSNTVESKGNQAIYQRLKPEGAKVAMLRLWVDVLATQVPTYQRGTDGKFMLDSAGYPIPTGKKITGHILKHVKTGISQATGGAFGEAAQMVGDQIATTGGAQSIRLPIMDIPVSSFGSYGDDLGLRMWAPTTNSRVAADSEMLEVNKAFPYVFACLDRSSDSIQNVQTTRGVQEVTCVFKPGQVKASVGELPMSFDERFYDSWNDRERRGVAPLFGPFDAVHVYHDNLVTLLKMLYTAEAPHINAFSDFDGSGFTATDDGEIHRFNFVSAKSSKNVPYESCIINRSDANAEAMSDISAVWAIGGSDGDLSDESFNKLVRAEMTKYGSIEFEVAENRLGNPESIFYDSGFNFATKLTLVNFIAVRKDTYLSWCLTDAKGKKLTAEEESSMAIALFTRGQMMPESSVHGTPACRFEIIACDGLLIGSTNRNRLPLSLEIASKSAQYMGAGDGLWKSEFAFSHGSRAEVSMFRDVNVTWRPIAARMRDWANGMVYVQEKDMDTLFFPGLRTGYSVERSVFTSRPNVLIMTDLEKVADRVWANFSGADSYSNEQFKKYVEAEFNRQIEGKYDARADIRPTVVFTAVDEYNGYSWSLNVDVGLEDMKTLQYTLITGYRRESMPAAN